MSYIEDQIIKPQADLFGTTNGLTVKIVDSLLHKLSSDNLTQEDFDKIFKMLCGFVALGIFIDIFGHIINAHTVSSK